MRSMPPKADLRDADLTGARLEQSQLRRADLRGANLAGTVGLTQEQLNESCADKTTKLPEGFQFPPSCRE